LPWRGGALIRRLWWQKLTAVLDTDKHLFRSAVVTRGPGYDAVQFRPAPGGPRPMPRDTLLGDGK
jgi:hypothetical protein